MRYFNKIFPKCLSLGETRWALGTAALLVSYWLKAFSCGFFLFGQQMKTSGDTVGNGPYRSPFLFGLFSKCLPYILIFAHKVFNTLWAYPKGSSIAISQ
jgi:hypothetical protein